MRSSLKKYFIMTAIATSLFGLPSTQASSTPFVLPWTSWSKGVNDFYNPLNMGSLGGLSPWTMMNPWSGGLGSFGSSFPMMNSMNPWSYGTGLPMMNGGNPWSSWGNGFGGGFNPYSFFSGNGWGDNWGWGRRRHDSDDLLRSLFLLNAMQGQSGLYPPNLGYGYGNYDPLAVFNPLAPLPMPNVTGMNGFNPNPVQPLPMPPSSTPMQPFNVPAPTAITPAPMHAEPISADGFPPANALSNQLNSAQPFAPANPIPAAKPENSWVFPDGSSVPYSTPIR